MTTRPLPSLRFETPVLLVGGGELDALTLAAAAARAGAVVAADSGADHLLRLSGPRPSAVIGDMDSISAARRWIDDPDVRFLSIAEQETTDLEKCLYSVAAPLFLAIGFFGARLDHTLAALHVAMRWREKRVVFLGAQDVCFLAPEVWRAELPAGARVSIWPGAPVRGLGSTGLRWPIEGLDFAHGAQIGTSNEAVGGPVEARFDREAAFVMLEPQHLDVVLASLDDGPV